MSDKVTRLVPLKELPEESRLVVKCAADIRPQKIDWLWEQRLPLGKCVLVAGEGGLGKSMVLAWIAATVSRGKEWPCGEGPSRRGSVVMLSAEDDSADTIKPRLMAADADCSKVQILEAVRREDDEGHRTFNLQLDLPELEKKIEELHDVLLVIIDPITSYLGKVDSHKNAELRSVLEPLGKMAARQHVTVIANTHLSKAVNGNANSRVIGSVAFINHARAAFIVTADPEDNNRRLFLPSKTNLGRPRDGLAYRIADTALPGPDRTVIWAPYVKWEATTVTISADEAVAAMAGGPEGRSTLEEAKQFLTESLAAGPMAAKEVQQAATAQLISVATLRRAKSSLGVEVSREGFGPGSAVLWSLPRHRCSTYHIDAQTKNVSTYDENERLCGGIAPQVEASKADAIVAFEERAASHEYDGGYTRAEAEALAAEEFPELPAFLDRRARP